MGKTAICAALVLAHPHLFFLAATLGLGVQLLTSAVIQVSR